MGSYFSNLHVKSTASLDSVKKAIRYHFTGAGYTVSNAESGNFFVELYAPEDGQWITICSEIFTHKDAIKLGKTLSAITDSETLSISCFDSDYMFLNLVDINKKLDLWLNIGEPYEMKPPRRGNLLAWKKYIADFKSFNDAAKQDYVCVEDFLLEVENHLTLPYSQSTRECFEGSEENTERLYFAVPKDELKPTTLKVWHFQLNPCTPGQRTTCFVENVGAPSKGIRIMFIGDYVKNDEITMEDVKFVYHDPSGNQIEVPITLKKAELNGGGYTYYWEDKDFNIPEAVPKNLPPKASMDESSKRIFGIRYTPVGNERKFLDICILFYPLENLQDGLGWWRVWGYHESKRDYIEHTNAEEREWARLCGTPLHLIDPEKYDLD